MSGSFVPLFIWTVIISCSIFFLLLGLVNYFSDVRWNVGEAFVQLSNPSPGKSGDFPVSEWVAIAIMNLFGLFILNGIILTLLVNWVSNRKERHEKGEARYQYIFKKRYSVIIGGHKIVASLARDIISNGKTDYILIQTQRNPERLRKEISAQITDDRLAGRIIIYSGDRDSKHELEELRLDSAQEVYIIGEPNKIDGTSHDAINIQTWELINDLHKSKKKPRIPCHVMFEFQSTFSAFQFTDMKLERSRAFRFIPFSVYENWAQQVLISKKRKGKPYYLPLDGLNGLPYPSHQRVHLIIVGMSKMGMAMAIEAAHIAHYPNFNNPHAGHPRTLITFIDRNARREMIFFMGRFRELFQLARWRYVKAPEDILPPGNKSWDIYDTIDSIAKRPLDDPYRWHDPLNDSDSGSPYCGGYLGDNLIDIDFEFIEGDVALPSIQKYISDACDDCSAKIKEKNKQLQIDIPDNSSKTTIAVCLPVAAEAMSAALYFESSVYENAQQIWVQQPESGALVDAVRYGLTGQDSAKFRILRPFGMLEQCDYLERTHNILPKLVAYAYECVNKHTTLNEEFDTHPLTDFIETVENYWLTISQEGGKSAIAKRWSNIYCANSFDSKIRAAGIDVTVKNMLQDPYTIKDIAKVEHNRWIMEQLLLGMKPLPKEYADLIPIENQELKNQLKAINIHPDLISNERLGSTKAYDEEIAMIIPLAVAIAEEYYRNN